jgi:hypothetical protein
MPNKSQRLKKQERHLKKVVQEKMKEDKQIQDSLLRLREKYFSIDPQEASKMLF